MVGEVPELIIYSALLLQSEKLELGKGILIASRVAMRPLEVQEAHDSCKSPF